MPGVPPGGPPAVGSVTLQAHPEWQAKVTLIVRSKGNRGDGCPSPLPQIPIW